MNHQTLNGAKVKLIPDSASGYTVTYDGQSIGRVEKDIQTQSFFATWGENGRAECRNRTLAVDTLVEIAKRK